MSADACATDVVGAIVSVVGADRPVLLVIVQAGAGAVAGIGVSAIIVGGITADRTGRQVRVCADPGVTDVVGAVVSVVWASRAIRFVIG